MCVSPLKYTSDFAFYQNEYIIIWLSKFPCFVPFKFYFMASLFRPTKLFDSIKMNLFKSFREREQMAFQGLSLSVETLIKAFIIGVKKSTMPIQAFHHKVIFRSGFICLYNYGTSWYFFQWISCHIDPSVAQVYRKTLHKALRTRGLSSADQSNFFRSIHKFLNKSWSNFILRISIKHQLQNLNKKSATS